MRRLQMLSIFLLFLCATARGQETRFSGPQVGEPLPSFSVRGVFEKEAGKELDFVKEAQGKPLVLIFVHDVNRQSISMVRTLTAYSTERKGDGLQTGVILLSDDANDAEKKLNTIQHALTKNTPTGVSIDGIEGPGTYGLNRNVMLTILIGKDSKVVANYALVQPSLQVDLRKIVESIVEVVGGKVPSAEELIAKGNPGQGTRESMAGPDMRSLMQPLIQLNATEEQVDKAAEIIEKKIAVDEAVKKEVARISKTIVNSGKLSNYGTKKAQDYLAKWAKEL